MIPVVLLLLITGQTARAQDKEPMVEATIAPQIILREYKEALPASGASDLSEAGIDWNTWQKRVDLAIQKRSENSCASCVGLSPWLIAKVIFVVTKAGEIKRVTVIETSRHRLFDAIVCQSVRSVNRDMALLAFPQGSTKDFIIKTGSYAAPYPSPRSQSRFPRPCGFLVPDDSAHHNRGL